MAHACPYCHVAAPDAAPVCPRCGAPQPVAQATAASPGEGWGRWIDPMEGAFAVMLPRGWAAMGGTFRGGPYGLPEGRFEARGDREGNLRVRIGGQAWQFQDLGMQAPGFGMLGGLMQMFGGMTAAMGGGDALPWHDAAAFAERWLLPRVRQHLPDASIQQMQPRPDVETLVRQKLAMDAAARGLGGYEVDGTVVDALMGYSEGGVRFLERLRVQTSRLRAGAMSWMTSTMPMTLWFAEIAFAYRAPDAGFAEAEPTLRAIAESLQRNPAWEAAQLTADNARALASQQQNMMRQRQISQTLSETSDIVSSGYWSREQIHQQHEAGRQAMGAPVQDWSHAWSNAMLGWEDRVDDTGTPYSVTAGHDRMWRDNAGNVITGDALTNPDPTWHELKKPGE
jgi:hypothetical protein